MTLAQINSLPGAEVQTALLRCCGSTAWAAAIVERRPFTTASDIENVAETVWWSLEKSDWLEAFSQHPKIGAQRASTQWSADEQSGMSKASDSTARRMAELNAEYQTKFGWIFIVCATGRTGEEMLASLTVRLANDKDEEIRIAAAEQAKITRIRLDKLLAE